MKYAIIVENKTHFAQKLPRLKEAIGGTLERWAIETAAYCIEHKLSGTPLHRRSGRLSRSVHGSVLDGDKEISGVVGAGRDVPYARIHEYGGFIRAHEVIARRAKALKIPLKDGRTIFRRSVMIPGIEMPERSYLRTSLKERAPSGIEQLKAVTIGVMQS